MSCSGNNDQVKVPAGLDELPGDLHCGGRIDVAIQFPYYQHEVPLQQMCMFGVGISFIVAVLR